MREFLRVNPTGKRLVGTVLSGLLGTGQAWAQPSVLGTTLADGSTYTTYNLATVASFRQVTVQASNGIGAGTGVWEFAQGTANSPTYGTNWRPYSSGLTFAGYNAFIPTSAAEGAKYNTNSGGCRP